MPIKYQLHTDREPEQPRRTHGGKFWLLVVLLLAAGIVIWGVLLRHHDSSKLADDTQSAATLVVTVTKPEDRQAANELSLPGNVHAWHEASLSARTTGYLKAWHHDIGDHVKGGELLAEIDTPEIDAQLRQTEADLALAKANSALAQTTAARWLALLKTDSVTQQETDEKVADAAAKAASVQSAVATRDRLLQQQNFKRIVAPFDGVVTNRATDIGSLITENGGELYHIAGTNPLRIYVNVPENYTSLLTPAMTARLQFTEHPGQLFTARLLSTAQAIDPQTRTLLVQFAVDNKDGTLFPGGYCEVHISVPASEKTLRLPANAFLFRAEGLQVATVGPGNKVAIKPVHPGRDFGTTIEVLSGLSPDDRVIVSPADSLYNGETVRLAPPPKPDGGKEQQQAKDGEDKDKRQSKDQDTAKPDSGGSQTTQPNGGSAADKNGGPAAQAADSRSDGQPAQTDGNFRGIPPPANDKKKTPDEIRKDKQQEKSAF